MSFQDFLEAREAYDLAGREMSSAIAMCMSKGNKTWNQVQADPKLKRLDKKLGQLRRHLNELTVFSIEENLRRFGLEIPTVSFSIEDGDWEGGSAPSTLPLSHICAQSCLWTPGTASEADKKNLVLPVFSTGPGGQPIGWIKRYVSWYHGLTDDLRFYYQANELRTALGWLLATDGGRMRLVECDLDTITQRMLSVIREHGVNEKTFFGAYGDLFDKTMLFDRTSRFNDGHREAKTTLWGVATKEITWDRHPGYAFK